ncbi:MAG: GIY-YIG nuclease family protein [Candidatus Moeniiplasma glomeromycotorum]|nr:GIY-YIG nuclease family protein [Candidatus Moeniiplasma glomeromycotorum]
MTDFSFNKGTNKLSFTIKHYTYTPKIVRYKTVNYVKYPIYEGYSERIKVIKKFDKVINPIKFVNEDILKLDLERHFILSIIEKIPIIPEWRKKELELKRILNLIDSYKRRIRNYHNEKKDYSFKKTNFNEEPSNFWLRLIFAPFTLGLSFIGYNSKKNALLNKKINKENKEWNASHKIKIDQENSLLSKEITLFNEECNRNISDYWNLYHKTKNKEIIWWDKEFHDGWKDLKLAADFSFQNLNGKKGVYIIRNETNKKHYVGQAKDLSVRLNQHFLDSKIIKTKNEELAKDWYRGDYFCYKYHPCQTKDELDSLEKQKIEEYNAFGKGGYNKTGGNL